jgi:hypothetical protein
MFAYRALLQDKLFVSVILNQYFQRSIMSALGKVNFSGRT